MKIQIIVSGGQLGTDCIQILGTDHQIIATDYPDIDIGEPASVTRICRDAKPEIIINCAAYTAVDKCESEREAARRINADGPRHIGEAAAAIGARVVHISTDYVFDGRREVPQPYVEDDPVNPLSEYGRSKLAGEQNLLHCCPDALVLRTAWLYSAHGPNFLKTMLRLALSDPERNFTIVDDQFGSLTWSDTLARQIGVLLDSDLTGIVHATSDGHSSWYEAACYFLKRMDIAHRFVPCATADYPTPAHRPANSILRNKVLELHGLSGFGPWQGHVDRFVEHCGKQLLEETKQQLARH
jgi:dTDP-4-dehydrorhamnose reductase